MAKKKDFPRQGDSQVGSSIPYLVAMLCDLKGKILVYLKWNGNLYSYQIFMKIGLKLGGTQDVIGPPYVYSLL
jgi:hypothetical protein